MNDGEDPTRLVQELAGTQCACGSMKAPKQTFCRDCYYSLPQRMRVALYRSVGDGYEQAYMEARKLLQEGGRIQELSASTESGGVNT